MATCFVIQPFDGGAFDKRYEDVFAPAIKDAGLEPYRVDRDPNVTIPIEAIEQGIRDAAVCLTDVTKDNPNVWFELGYALALNKDVVLVCSKERTGRFPFDIQHRSIITYATESSSDFDKLKTEVAARIKAGLKKGRELDVIAASPLKEAQGLSPHEMVCLVVIMENTPAPGDVVWPQQVQQDMRRAGYRDIATSLSLRSLLKKEMVAVSLEDDRDGNPVPTYKVTEAGVEWLLANQDKIQLERAAPEPRPGDDIPF